MLKPRWAIDPCSSVAVMGVRMIGNPPGTVIVPEMRAGTRPAIRSEEHTSELQSLMRISYAVFCLKQKKQQPANPHTTKLYTKPTTQPRTHHQNTSHDHHYHKKY